MRDRANDLRLVASPIQTHNVGVRAPTVERFLQSQDDNSPPPAAKDIAHTLRHVPSKNVSLDLICGDFALIKYSLIDRGANDFLCLWRVCGNATCRRARSCRRRAHLCAKRNSGAVPPPVREFFFSFLAAKSVGVDFEDFRDEMEGRDETEAFFAWRSACARSPR